jgi:Nodulation protein S (NodS)
MTVSHDTEHFRLLYARSDDPWAFQNSGYEQEKYRHTIAALGEWRFRSGFEPGCSIGLLTRMLATSCDALLAADIVEEALHTARSLCSDLPWVRFACMRIPAEWLDGRFDLKSLRSAVFPDHLGHCGSRSSRARRARRRWCCVGGQLARPWR